MAKMERVSRDEVLACALELAKEYGESLTLTAFRRETGYSQWLIFDLFENWKNLGTAVGLTPEAPRARNKVSKEEILVPMREMAEQHGEFLTELIFLKATGFSGRMIADRFGSWGALRQAVGLKARAKIQRHYTDEELIEDMYRVYRRYRGRPIYHQHQRRGGKISPGTIRDRFGSWEGAKAGLKAFLRRRGVYDDKMPLPVEDRELFDEIRFVPKR